MKMGQFIALGGLGVLGLVVVFALASLLASGTPSPAQATATAVAAARVRQEASAKAPTPVPASKPTAAPASTAAAPTVAAATAAPAKPALPTLAALSPTAPQKPAPGTPSPAAAASDGNAEFRLSADARNAARSWRMRMELVQPGQTLDMVQEIVCPDRLRTRTTAGNQTIEMIQIGVDSYTNAGGRWIKSSVPGTPALCGGAPRQSPTAQPTTPNRDPTGDFSNLGQDVRISKGGVSPVDGVPCQEWTVRLPPGKEGDMSYTVWIGVADRLPRRLKTLDGKMTITYSDWNASITINPPI